MKTAEILKLEQALVPVGLAAVLAGVSYARMRVLVQKGAVRTYLWVGCKLVGWASLQAWLKKQGRECAEAVVAIPIVER